MGGMIGQTMAILQPERVRSLVSMMSTTGNRRVGSPTFRAWGLLLAKFPHGRDEYVKRALRTFRVIGSPDHRDEREIEELAGAMYDRGHDTAAIVRQMHAISASGDRTAGLERLQVPTTVLHGAEDPLARPAAGRATAAAIPGARLRIFEGMGHDLPRALWPDFVDEIAATAERGGATLRPAPARPPEDAPGRRAMRLKGVEPSRALAHTDLNRARLPVPPQPREQAIYRLAAAPRSARRDDRRPPLARIATPRRYRLGD